MIFQFGQKKKSKEPEKKDSGFSRAKLFRMIAGGCVFVVLVSIIAFWGRPPHTPVVFEGMMPTYQFDAPFEFSYESAVRKQMKEKEVLHRIVPAYRPNMREIDSSLEKYTHVAKKISERFAEITGTPDRGARLKILRTVFEEEKFAVGDPALRDLLDRVAMDILQLIDLCQTPERYLSLSKESSRVFRELAAEGIVENEHLRGGNVPERQHVRTITEFKKNFSEQLEITFWKQDIFNGLPISQISLALPVSVDLYSPLIHDNMVFDEAATKQREKEALAAIGSVLVTVEEDTPLLKPGVRVDEEDVERWNVYRKKQTEHEVAHLGIPISFFMNLLYVFCVVVIAEIYRKLMIPARGNGIRRRFLFTGVISVINILLIRGILELTESRLVVQSFGTLGDALVWLSLPAVVAISVSAIAGASLGVPAALFVGAIAAQMLGGNIQVLVMISVASLIAVWISRNAKKRATLVRAGFYSGLAMAVTAVCIGYYAETSWHQICLNTLFALLSGLFYGIVSAGLLGLFEGVFRTRTDITFIELADFNHPLLRKLQLVAPGTFHHCVMVSNYAEQAAHAVGANTALCRCASLFHDIGKTLKPEYFTENQGNERNPHDDITPQMSALIIKSHVRDGVELAVEYHLPERVRDIIEQHHGTSLVGYFFKKAKDLAVSETGEGAGTVDESHFRYDGPKPQSLEAAIVMMCDVVEAASRSLKKITPQAVEDLVASLIRSRIQDGEFDECPITISQISAIRRSLVLSVLTTFHSRVEYPKDAGGVQPAGPVPVEHRTKVRIVRKFD